ARPLLAALLVTGTLSAYGLPHSIQVERQAQAAALCAYGRQADLGAVLWASLPCPRYNIPLADGRKASLEELKCQTLEPRCNLRGVDWHGIELAECNFNAADLRGANLRDSCLPGCDLRGADLQGADLRGATLDGT